MGALGLTTSTVFFHLNTIFKLDILKLSNFDDDGMFVQMEEHVNIVFISLNKRGPGFSAIFQASRYDLLPV